MSEKKLAGNAFWDEKERSGKVIAGPRRFLCGFFVMILEKLVSSSLVNFKKIIIFLL